MAEQIDKSRKAHADRGKPRLEDLSADASTAAMDAARNMQSDHDRRADRDGEQMPDSGRDALKRAMPEAATTMEPRAIAASQFTRDPLRAGHASYSRDYRPEQHSAPASAGVSGDGPMANTILEHGGRRLQRPSPRPGGDA
jgi:curved DNA-binding protein CbpA